jgi:hypothetical protein
MKEEIFRKEILAGPFDDRGERSRVKRKGQILYELFLFTRKLAHRVS